jgi:hypothetical protein
MSAPLDLDDVAIGASGDFQWVMGPEQSSGRVVILTSEGGRVSIPPECVGFLAASLAEYCRDNQERSFVADEWGPIWDDDDDEVMP